MSLLKTYIFILAVFFPLILSRPILAGTGVITGNGSDKTEYTPIEIPNENEVFNFLNRLLPSEHEWVGIIERGLMSNDEALSVKPIKFLRNDDSCFFKNNPNNELRAFFRKDINVIVFCKSFYLLTKDQQTATVLHELSHYALSRIDNDLGDGEEVVVKQMEYFYLQMITAPDIDSYKKAVLGLRELLDRNVKDLINFSKPYVVVPTYTLIPVLKNGQVKYPVPASWKDSDYIPAHFLEYNLSKVWTDNVEGKAALLKKMDTNINGNNFPKDSPIWNMDFYIGDNLFKKADRLITGVPMRCLTLKPILIKSSELSDEFLEIMSSGKLGFNWIRTLGMPSNDKCSGTHSSDNVYFFGL